MQAYFHQDIIISMKSRLKLRQPLIPVIVGLLLGLQIHDPSRAYTILLVTFSGISIMSYIWAWSLGKGIQLHRETRLSWVQVGNHLEEHLTLSNTSVFPAPYIELIDHSTLPDFNGSRVTSVNAEASDKWTATSFCKQRGLFQLGDAQIMTSDPLGMFEVTLHAALQTPILVLPQPSILPEFGIAPSGIVGDGQPRQNALHQSIHVSTVREFAEGDSMRQIHWPTTARKGRTFVRLMENAPEGKWWIVLDLDQDSMRGNGWDSIEEQSVSLAASLADLGLRGRKSTGLVSNGQDFRWLPPQGGDAQQWQILQTLALAKPGKRSLAGLFDKMFTALGNNHSLLIVTACTQVNWVKSLPSLAKRGLIPTVFLMDTSHFDGTDSMQTVATTLAKHDIRYHMIPHGMIEPPRMEPIPFSTLPWDAIPASRVFPVKNS